mgnify:CR=1 FL=1
MINEKELELVQRILKQAIEISSNSIIDVFVEFASHVNLISVKVFLEGWNSNKREDYRKDVWFKVFSEDKCIKELEEITRYLGGKQDEISR